MQNKVLIKIYGGGAWEGHVAYLATHPQDSSVYNSSSTIDEIKAFCHKKDLAMDEEFIVLVKKHLIFDIEKGLVIPLEEINEKAPISSANKYLKQNFANYC